MIILDYDLHELGEIETDLDVEIGSSDSTNDFELTNATMQDIHPGGFYIPGTEIGGLIDYTKDRAEQDYTTLRGYTWRGLLAQRVIMPPAGSNYRVVSGDANAIISGLIGNDFDGIFTVSTESSGLTITSYQIPLYVNLLDGIEVMLEKYGYRLQITATKIASNEPIQILIEAVEATLIAGTFNEDNGIPMSFEVDNMGINHLICAGQGELQNRMIRHLYIDANGEVSTTQYYFGLEERQQFYDYSSAQSEDDLIDNGRKRLLELASHKTLSMQAPSDYTLEIGDLIKGGFPDGTVIISPIVKKIYKISDGIIKTDYKIKGE